MFALSGIAFAVLLLVGWFLSAGDAPDYTAANEDWIDWAEDNRSRSGIGALLILLAGFVVPAFRRNDSKRARVRGDHGPRLRAIGACRVHAGAITGIVGITMAIVMIGARRPLVPMLSQW
jgi:hypothetical protein